MHHIPPPPPQHIMRGTMVSYRPGAQAVHETSSGAWCLRHRSFQSPGKCNPHLCSLPRDVLILQKVYGERQLHRPVLLCRERPCRRFGGVGPNQLVISFLERSQSPLLQAPALRLGESMAALQVGGVARTLLTASRSRPAPCGQTMKEHSPSQKHYIHRKTLGELLILGSVHNFYVIHRASRNYT